MAGTVRIICSNGLQPIFNKTPFFAFNSHKPSLSHKFLSLPMPTLALFPYLSTPLRFSLPPDSQLSVEVSTETREWAMQDFYALRKDVENTSERVEEIVASAGLEQLEAELATLESKTAETSLWDDRAKAQEILSSLTNVKDKIKLLKDFKRQVEEAETIVNLTEEMDSIDTTLLQEAASIIKELNKALDRFELTQLLSGPYDKEGAVISITAGAGGTDAQCRIGLTCFSGCI